jgi:hypothetical protein
MEEINYLYLYYKQRSGRHTLARQKNIQKKKHRGQKDS